MLLVMNLVIVVILSGVAASLREAAAQSKDPYQLISPRQGRSSSTWSHRATRLESALGMTKTTVLQMLARRARVAYA
jgi:hypothetical protein